MTILTHFYGGCYGHYVDRLRQVQPNLVVDEAAPMGHQKLGKIGALLRLPDDSKGPVVLIDADLVLLRPLRESDFPVKADIEGVVIPLFSPDWTNADLGPAAEPFRPSKYVPPYNSGLLCFRDLSTARSIASQWLSKTREMSESGDWVRDELTLSNVLADGEWSTGRLSPHLNDPHISESTVGWHDLSKSLPTDLSQQSNFIQSKL